MRPVGFYYNLYGFVNAIKMQGVMASNYGPDDRIPWVSPLDIATAVAEEIVAPAEGRTVRYVVSDEPTCNEVARVLGAAIGKSDLGWVLIPEEQLHGGLVAFGMNPTVIAGLVEINASMHTGVLFADYYRHRPAELGKVMITDFAQDFATVYQQS